MGILTKAGIDNIDDIEDMTDEELDAQADEIYSQIVSESIVTAKEDRLATAIAAALPKRYRGAKMDNIPQQAKEYISKLISEPDFEKVLLLIGPAGTGKTYTAAAIVIEAIKAKKTVSFGTFADHLARIQAGYSDNTAQDYIEKMRTADLLILDDLGREKLSEFTKNTLFTVINARYNDMLPSVVTTNMTPAELKDYLGDAIYSRIFQTAIGVTVTGNDRRRRQI